MQLYTDTRTGKGPQKKEKKKTRNKKTIPKKKPTDFPLFFLKVPLATAVGRLWTCHRMWAPAAGCGVFLCELVPSDDPFMWCLCETVFFCGHFFFQRTFFSSSEQ
jgi:hypothetical protein